MATSPPMRRRPRRPLPPRAGDVRPLDSRGHELVPHTADVGLLARAGDLAGLFEEAAAAFRCASHDRYTRACQDRGCDTSCQPACVLQGIVSR